MDFKQEFKRLSEQYNSWGSLKERKKRAVKNQNKKSRKHFTPDKSQVNLIDSRKNSEMSRAEKKIADYLMGNGLAFIREHYFNDLTHKGKPLVLFFDFYLPKYNVCIEYDGQQHYTHEFNGKHTGNLARNDYIKTQYCKKNGVKLLRIKYTQFHFIEKVICEFFDKHYPTL